MGGISLRKGWQQDRQVEGWIVPKDFLAIASEISRDMTTGYDVDLLGKSSTETLAKALHDLAVEDQSEHDATFSQPTARQIDLRLQPVLRAIHRIAALAESEDDADDWVRGIIGLDHRGGVATSAERLAVSAFLDTAKFISHRLEDFNKFEGSDWYVEPTDIAQKTLLLGKELPLLFQALYPAEAKTRKIRDHGIRAMGSNTPKDGYSGSGVGFVLACADALGLDVPTSDMVYRSEISVQKHFQNGQK